MDLKTEQAKFKTLYDATCKLNSKYCNSDVKLILDTKDLGEFQTLVLKYAETYHNSTVKEYPKPKAPPNEIIALYLYLRDMNTRLQHLPGDSECLAPIAAKFGFDSIAGMEYEKSQFRTYFIYPNEFTGLFRDTASNILLRGSIGVGKSLIVRAAIKELKNVIFFAPTSGSIRGKFEGETEKNIDNLFRCASDALKNKQYIKAVIFFDEFDAIAAKSDDPIQGRARAALLTNIDGISSNPNVAIIAATNFVDRIDEAILRRFTQQIYVNLPARAAREWIVKDEIAKAFMLPGKHLKCTDTKRCLEIFNNNFTSAMDLLKEFGSIEKVGKEDLRFNLKFINTIVEMTGPKLNSNKNQGDDKLEYSSAAIYEYGYSASDMVKVMKLAISKCSQRAISEDSKYMRKEIKGEYYYILSQNGDYYISDDDDEKSMGSKKIPRSEYSKVISFDIIPSDVISTIKTYKPTYNIDEYVKDIKDLKK